MADLHTAGLADSTAGSHSYSAGRLSDPHSQRHSPWLVLPPALARGPVIRGWQPARRGEVGWVHDVCSSQTD